MPRFAANLAWLFTEHPFLERFAAARAAGFDGVEFPTPYDTPAAAIAEQLQKHKLTCVLFNLPMGDRSRGDIGIACRPGREAEFREGVASAIEYARLLRPTRVNCIAGVCLPDEDRGDMVARLVQNLQFAAGELAKAGFDMLVEPLNDRDNPSYIIPRQDDGARVINAVGAPTLGLQCDLYHTAMMGDDPSSILSRHRGVIRHIQFADAPGRNEPGTGKVPLQQLFDTIDELGYEGWVSAEYKPTRRTEDTLHWMRATA
jgi:hydroxypyruvate isomerase